MFLRLLTLSPWDCSMNPWHRRIEAMHVSLGMPPLLGQQDGPSAPYHFPWQLPLSGSGFGEGHS